jgi:hypothetical protein
LVRQIIFQDQNTNNETKLKTDRHTCPPTTATDGKASHRLAAAPSPP